MKKIIYAFVILFSLLITSCGTSYPAVESSAQESEVMFTLKYGNKEYDVKYELYRAFFLTYKSQVDGDDPSVWTGDRRDEYIAQINELIIPMIANIYATINLAERIGVNFSSKDVKNKVNDLIKLEVEGGVYNGETKLGYGTYDKFLAALRAKNHNYSTCVLLFHYAIAQTKIAEYYIGTLNDDNFTPDATVGKLEFTREDVKAFYDSDDCVRVLRAFIEYPQNVDPEHELDANEEVRQKAYEVYNLIRSASTTEDVSTIIISETSITIEEGNCGLILGKHTLDELNYKKITDAAFALAPGAVSEVLEVLTGDENGYHILYSAEKSNAHFDKYYSLVKDAYLNHVIGKMINDTALDLLADVEYTDEFENLAYDSISMN